jgi:hypothetical protein
MPSAAGVLKHTFCLGDHTQCARFQVASSGKPVPADLFPNHRHRVTALIQARA